MAPTLIDYHQKSTVLRSKILKNQEERVQLEQKLHSLSNVDSRLKQRQQIDQIQSYFTNLDQESQRAKQRNSQLLNDITQAERNLDKLRTDAEHLIRLKHDYLQYLESNYPDWQKRIPTGMSTNVNTYDFNRLNQQHDDQSISESTSNTFSRSKRSGSLRMELNRAGLDFLLNYIEKELIDTIDKKKFYHHDPPTITQKRTILDIANNQQQFALKDLDPTTTSMVILDQLPSTIRRTTIHKCLLTEEILSSNIIDLNKDIITNMLPEQDRSLWIRLIDHFTRLLKYHIMNSEILANKFAPLLLPNNVLYLHDKAKSLLKHILEKLIGTQQLSSDDETSTNKKQPITKTNTTISSSWLNKLTPGGRIDDDIDDTSSSSSSSTPKKKNIKSPSSTATTPRGNINQHDSDLEFFS
jgi:hypothetical protein